MRQKYIPLGKRSKREQRDYFATHRKNWGGINPVTRRAPNPKAYNRKNPNDGQNINQHPDFLI